MQGWHPKYSPCNRSSSTSSSTWFSVSFISPSTLTEPGVMSRYFSMYSGDDGTFRTRVLKSYPYFKNIIETQRTDYKNYEIAESYYIIGEFYSQYVVNTTSVKEPNKEIYENLLNSIYICMNHLEAYESDDAAYTCLTMYREISNLLNDHRKGLAAVGVEQESVIKIMNMIQERTKKLAVTQGKSIDLRNTILNSYEDYIENIKRSYTNTEEWNEMSAERNG